LELVDLAGAHRGEVANAVEEDEPPDPADVGVLGPGAVAAEADGLADAIQQTRWVRSGRGEGMRSGRLRREKLMAFLLVGTTELTCCGGW
jgi:hypothetical protein